MKSKQKNILLIGLGAVGYVLIKALHHHYKSSDIKLHFFVLSRNAEFEKDLRGGGIKYTTILAEDFSIFLSSKTRFDNNIDLAINCTSPYFNTLLLDRCVLNKSNYLDLASDIGVDEVKRSGFIQSGYDQIFKKNKLIGIYNAGVSPGISELLISYVVRKNNITPRSIQLYLQENFDSVIPLWSWSPSVAIDEMLTKPVYIENNKIKYGEVFDPQEKCVGKKKTHYYRVTQEELVDIRSYYPAIGDIAMYVTGSEIEKVKFLYDIGLLSDDKIGKQTLLDITKSKMPRSATPRQIIQAHQNKLIDDARFGFDIKIIGSDNKIHHISLDYDIDAFKKVQKTTFVGSTSISYPTGVGASMIASMILDENKVNIKGIYNCMQIGEIIDLKCIKSIVKSLNKKYIKIKLS